MLYKRSTNASGVRRYLYVHVFCGVFSCRVETCTFNLLRRSSSSQWRNQKFSFYEVQF
jgi:hypothetical protein